MLTPRSLASSFTSPVGRTLKPKITLFALALASVISL